MKRPLIYAILCCAITLSACNVFKKSNATNQSSNAVTNEVITGKKWKLIELAGKPVPDKVNDKIPFMRFLKEDNRYTGSGGCNTLNGTYTLAGNNRIRFSRGISTMMACKDMSVETGLGKVLLAADNYTVNGNILSLNKARMAPLARFEAVDENAGAHVLNGTWELNYISGPRIAFEGLYPRKKPTLTFDFPSTKAVGNSSCNSYNIAFTLDGNNIKFAAPVSTKMACEGSGEATFFNMLKTISKYSVSGDGKTLNLITGDIAVMRFEKK